MCLLSKIGFREPIGDALSLDFVWFHQFSLLIGDALSLDFNV